MSVQIYWCGNCGHISSDHDEKGTCHATAMNHDDYNCDCWKNNDNNCPKCDCNKYVERTSSFGLGV